MARERAWIVHLEGYPEVSTNDMTLDEAELIERVSGVPWSLLNPLSSIKIAKPMLSVLAMRAGMSEDDALKLASELTLRKLHGAFEFDPGDQGAPPADAAEVPDPPSSAPTSAIG